ncbi:MAG TPA: bifunctional [glutamine synthetase] adenylyltransferase/[glutamine synthetase]-adenylyl-L-tyrosine phosphorylase, partial [Mycobacteriales bacterium]|nr:bifunctional [glutamine synthetase] adenylyltransferase/[glutamine synthetase]-adenylyl-L-tyrosine phosphorylase [Mycobacteriales bacterium]
RVSAPLTRLGFRDAERAMATLHELGLWDGDRPDAAAAAGFAQAGDPDLAVRSLVRLLEAAGDSAAILAAIRADEDVRDRLFAVLGASTALGDHLAANPEHWHVLRDGRAGPVTGGNVIELRHSYRARVLELAGRDLTGAVTVDEVGRELADLAGETIAAALAACGLAEAPCRLAVIGMGKCGGRELNYVSDVDVVFVAEPLPGGDEAAALTAASAVAAAMISLTGPVAWPVDAALRPEGKNGPLVRTLASHEAYYRRWARTWEFQALLKARLIAGDQELGEQYLRRISPLVWAAAEREHFVEDVQAMRRRVEDTLPPAVAERELKLGPGGLRDVEFAVQLLQLVHGRADESLRVGATTAALAALAEGGYVGREDARALAEAYRFLRTAEHRLQLQRLRRTHLLPDDPVELRWLARTMRLDPRGDPSSVFAAEHARHARQVRRLHEKLFYRPLLAAVARIPTEELRLTPEAARVRLSALGFADSDRALQHLGALTEGVSRRASIQRTLLPALLGTLADAPDPDGGLLAYRQVSEALQDTPWYLRLLRDGGAIADRLSRVLGSSRFVADLLVRAPEGLRLLGYDTELQPRRPELVRSAMRGIIERNPDPDAAVRGLRGVRRHELLRTACADLLDLTDEVQVGRAVSDLAAATLDAALTAASRGREPGARIAVIAMGRLGGAESGYGSDADVLFVYEPLPGVDDRAANSAATAICEQVGGLLASPAPDPPLVVDTALRPEGRNGSLVRSLASYTEYYSRWKSVWEVQALLRARPIAGDAELGERFVAMIDPIRYPAGGLNDAAVTEIRRIKARVDAERLPRGADPATHTKLGPGALADIEWTVQLLQLCHACDVPGLRTPVTLDALAATVGAGLLGPDAAAALEASWRLNARARNAIVLVRGKPDDQLPRPGRTLAGVMRALGYPPGRDTGQFLDDYRRATRRARRVVEQVFYAR